MLSQPLVGRGEGSKEQDSVLGLTLNSQFASRNGFDFAARPSIATSNNNNNPHQHHLRASSNISGSNVLKSYTSPTSTDVENVVKKIN